MEPSSGDAKRPPGVLCRQANVIFIILCLAFCSNAASTDDSEHRFELYSSLLAVPGLLLLIVLAECKGRKPLLITLFLLFIISLFFRTILPVVQAATMILTPVVLCEYTNPKFRMPLLIVNFAVLRISSWLGSDTNDIWMFNWDYFSFGLAIGCIFSIMTWPESPYWLSSKKRFAESKQEFLSLRGEGSQSRDELQALMEETPRQGSSKMFYAPLLVAFPVLFVSSYLSYLDDMLGIDVEKLPYVVIVNVICALITALISLKLSRRIFFFSSVAILFTLLIVAWILHYYYDDYLQVKIVLILVSYIALTCGPIGVFVPILIEIIPQKYVSIMSAFFGCVHCFINIFIVLWSNFIDEVPILCLSVILSFASAFFFLPEAKDKTLLEIENLYLPKTKENQSLIKTEL